MVSERATALFQHVHRADLATICLLNRACYYRIARDFFAAVSRLGDGIFWYGLMALLPLLYGTLGWHAAVNLFATGFITLPVYKLLKSKTTRERPFVWEPAIVLGAAPLDRYSFPSGHTLQAVALTIVALAYLPQLAVLLVGFTALVALSRVVLGLHFPTDVVAGAVLGVLCAEVSLRLVQPLWAH